MIKDLCIKVVHIIDISKLKVAKLLIEKYRMHNLYAIFAKLLNICKQVAGNLVNESGNVPRRGVVPKFSDLEIVALNMTSEIGDRGYISTQVQLDLFETANISGSIIQN